jgi:hypothetical protein
MEAKKLERGDEGNSAFEPDESALESTRPGATYGDEHDRDAGGGQASAEGHHRLRRRPKKDIPQESLADRIRRASKGG